MSEPRLESALDPPRLADGWRLDGDRLRNGDLTIRLDRITTAADAWAAVVEANAWIREAAPRDSDAPLAALVGTLAAIYQPHMFPPHGRLHAGDLEVLIAAAAIRKPLRNRRPPEHYCETQHAHLSGPRVVSETEQRGNRVVYERRFAQLHTREVWP